MKSLLPWIKSDKKIPNSVHQERQKARDPDMRALSPYRTHRENGNLKINGLPYTGINEFNYATDVFEKQDNIYQSLRKQLNEPTLSPLKKNLHEFNSKRILEEIDGKPRVQTVNLQGGPDVALERRNNPINNLVAHAVRGSYNKDSRVLNIYRLDPTETEKITEQYNLGYQTAGNAYRDQIRANNGNPDVVDTEYMNEHFGPLLSGHYNDTPINTKNHEETHANTLHRHDASPYFSNFQNHDFGDDTQYKSLPAIIANKLKFYPKEKYPQELIANLMDNIDRLVNKQVHEPLGLYLKESLDYFKDQNMKDDYPDLYNKLEEFYLGTLKQEDIFYDFPENNH